MHITRSAAATVARMFLLLAILSVALMPPVQAQTGATLRIAMPPIPGATAQSPLPEPLSLAPEDADARDLIENLFVGLFRYDAAAHSAVPVLAREWTVSDDGLTWTFTLRDDIQWVGYNPDTGQIAALRPVDAADAVAALRRACHPLKPSPPTAAIFVIQGCYTAAQAQPLLVDDQRVADWVGAEAPDSTTLILHLALPVNYLPALLTEPAFRPVPREFVDFTPAYAMIASSGPYVLTDWTLGESLTLVRNPFWPEALPGNIEQVTITYLADDTARAEAFGRGAVDFTRFGAALPAGLSAEAVQVWRGLEVTVLGFSAERTFVNERGVRQALSWALDREALLAGDASVLPIRTLTDPRAVAGPPESVGVGYEPEAARAALTAAGFPNCSGVPEIITLAVPPDRVPLGEAMVASWAETLGCAPALFEIEPTPPDDLIAISRDLIPADTTIRPHLWLASWLPTYPDAQGGAGDAFHCRFGYFYSATGCGPVDALIDRASSTMPEADRPAAYRVIERRLFGPAGLYPAAPLYAAAVHVGVAAGLTGVHDYGPLWWADLDRQ